MSTMRNTEDLQEDFSSFCESESIYSTSSTVWGPGALTGKFLKALGEKSLGFLESVRIRKRLATIRQTLEKTPHVFVDPQTYDERRQAIEMYSDLKELCRESYSLSLRRTAANLICDIVLNTRPSGPTTISDSSIPLKASHAHTMWKQLLARLQRPGGLLRVPPETVVTVDRQASEASQALKVPQENIPPIGPDNPIKVDVTVEITQSYEPPNGTWSGRRLSRIGPRILQQRRRRNVGDKRHDSEESQLQHGPEPACNDVSRPTTNTTSWLPTTRAELGLTCVSKLAQAIRGRIRTVRRRPMQPSGSCSTPKNFHSARLRTDTVLGSAPVLNNIGTPVGKRGEYLLVSPSIDSKKFSKLQLVNPETTISASVMPNPRILYDIQQDLDHARKTLHALELELMHASLVPLE